jgi:hypothetical protein
MGQISLFFLFICLLTLPVEAQFLVDDEPIPDNANYVSIISRERNFGRGMVLWIDYGQYDGRGANQVLRDMDRKRLDFLNAMEAVNYLSERGWELHLANTSVQEWPRQHYIMRRKKAIETEDNKNAKKEE